jgi:hypothetical protein
VENNQLLESAKKVEEQVRYARYGLARIRNSIKPGQLCESKLTVAFKSLDQELAELDKEYRGVLGCLEKAKPCYPSQNQPNIQKKIILIKETIEYLEKIRQNFKNLQSDIEDLPVILFEHAKEET